MSVSGEKRKVWKGCQREQVRLTNTIIFFWLGGSRWQTKLFWWFQGEQKIIPPKSIRKALGFDMALMGQMRLILQVKFADDP